MSVSCLGPQQGKDPVFFGMHSVGRLRSKIVKSTAMQNAMDDVQQKLLPNRVAPLGCLSGRHVKANCQIDFDGLIAGRMEPAQHVGWPINSFPLLVQLRYPGVIKQSDVDLLHCTREVLQKLVEMIEKPLLIRRKKTRWGLQVERFRRFVAGRDRLGLASFGSAGIGVHQAVVHRVNKRWCHRWAQFAFVAQVKDTPNWGQGNTSGSFRPPPRAPRPSSGLVGLLTEVLAGIFPRLMARMHVLQKPSTPPAPCTSAIAFRELAGHDWVLLSQKCRQLGS